MKEKKKVLVCDDDLIFQVGISETLKTHFQVFRAHHGDEALEVLKNESIELLLLDINLRRCDEGLEYIPKFFEIDNDLSVVVVSFRSDFSSVRQAMRLGAIDYLTKDFQPDELIHILNLALQRQQLIKRNQQQNFEALAIQRQHVLVGESSCIIKLRRNIEKIKNSTSNVIITGETGTGKELVARQLRATRQNGTLEPFLAIDSSTIQSATAVSSLFGHEKGAFTGADKMSKGIFEEANGGTVYFDEISNMPLEIQSKLLRVLQEKEIVRLGSSKTIGLEFRVICATNQDVEQLVKQGSFKYDLYQRLNVLPICVPPLRERRDDIPLLVEYFAARESLKGRNIRFTETAIGALQLYSWPGNVRELSNLVSFLSTMTETGTVGIHDLPDRFLNALPAEKVEGNRGIGLAFESDAEARRSSTKVFYERVREFERNFLSLEFQKSNGNITQLAFNLGMDRSYLYTKLKEYGIYVATRKERRADEEVDL